MNFEEARKFAASGGVAKALGTTPSGLSAAQAAKPKERKPKPEKKVTVIKLWRPRGRQASSLQFTECSSCFGLRQVGGLCPRCGKV